jgi:uncharacterized protein (UPF0335 family)
MNLALKSRPRDKRGVTFRWLSLFSQGALPMVKFGGIAADQLRSIIERVEKLEEEKSAIAADIREVFAEAKGNGYDIKALRQIIKIRKMEAAERQEQEAVLDTYLRALGMLPEMDEAA